MRRASMCRSRLGRRGLSSPWGLLRTEDLMTSWFDARGMARCMSRAPIFSRSAESTAMHPPLVVRAPGPLLMTQSAPRKLRLICASTARHRALDVASSVDQVLAQIMSAMSSRRAWRSAPRSPRPWSVERAVDQSTFGALRAGDVNRPHKIWREENTSPITGDPDHSDLKYP